MLTKGRLLAFASVWPFVIPCGAALPAAKFSGPVYSTTSGQPPYANSLATGDFNRDGKLDLAIGYFISSTGLVRVFLGRGDGQFDLATNLTSGAQAMGLAVGDFNSDGNPDLAIANDGVPNLAIFLGNGDGSFISHTNIDLGIGLGAISVADVDGDGTDDIVALGLALDGQVRVLTGQGDGSFVPASTNSVPARAQWMAVGDLNRDAKVDIVTANVDGYNGAGSVSVLLAATNGGFLAASNYAAGTSSFSVAIGDFDNDGWPDLFVANHSVPGSISVLRGQGAGSFVLVTNWPTSSYPEAMTTGDFNGDGNLDLAVTYNNGNFIKILFGNGQGQFPVTTNLSAGPAQVNFVLLADINGDGRPDLIKTDDGYRPASVFLNHTLPSLRIEKGLADVAILWPRWDGLYLEAASAGFSTNGWLTVPTNTYTTIGNVRRLTDSSGLQNQFYRLKSVQYPPDPTPIADTLTDRNATNVSPSVLRFVPPAGNGRGHRTGVLAFGNPSFDVFGSTWEFDYQRNDWGVQVVHPFASGQCVITLHRASLGLSTPSRWLEIGYGSGDTNAFALTPAFTNFFPLLNATNYHVKTAITAGGLVSVSLNGSVVATGTVSNVHQIDFNVDTNETFQGVSTFDTRQFSGAGFPVLWQKGYTGIIIEPVDTGYNRLYSITYTPGL